MIQCSNPNCHMDNHDNEDFCLYCSTPLKTAEAITFDLPRDTVLLNGKHPYEIIGKIERGGFGITYRAKDKITGEIVVIKERFPGKGRSGLRVLWGSMFTRWIPGTTKNEVEAAIEEFRREAEIMQKCVHESVVRYQDCFEENDTCYIVMAFIKGKSLGKLIDEQKTVPESQLRRYFLQIAEALREVHNQGILHRDIKPDNIMIATDHDRAILIDFGTAREFAESVTQKHTQILTFGYAPLEQFTLNSKRTASADIYSLCASIYHAISGYIPIASMDRAVSQKDKGVDSLQPPSQLRTNITPELEEIILTGMEMNVQQRFLNADQLIEFLNGNPVSRKHIDARKLVRQSKLDQAIQKYEDVLSSQKDNFKALIELAQILLHQNKLDEAKVYAERALQQKPNDQDTNGVLGLIYCRKSEWQKAVQHLQQATSTQPKKVWILLNFAWALGKTNNWSRATKVSDEALNLNETQDKNEYLAFAKGLKAWISANTGDWNQAIPNAIQASYISKSPNFKNAQELQYWVYPCQALAIEKHLGSQHTQMSVCLDNFSALLPNNSFVTGFKGWQAIARGDINVALPLFEQATTKNNVPRWIWLNLAILHEKSKDVQKAVQTYDNYLKIFKDDSSAMLRLGTLLGDQKNWERAFELFDRATSLQSDNAEAFHNKGWTLLHLLKSSYSIKGKDQTTLYKDMVDSYTIAVSLYSKQGKSAIVDTLKNNKSLTFIP
jgi:eukaryotic-like serine/threonine-protein kinase